MSESVEMPSLRDELLGLAQRDRATRARLAASGELYEGYHPEMERVHTENGRRLSRILDEHGWPGTSRVGVDGAEAAWLVLQHAIALPDLQRRGLALLRDAAERGEASLRHVAMLTDRIRVFEGRKQRYGTQHDWDEEGRLSPHPIEEPDRVEELRRRVNLEPLTEQTRRLREEAQAADQTPPDDPEARRQEMEAWCRRVGWR